MATWKSPLFSDIRNKLGENVVFSMWKGRPYMRSYVRPSNPNTLKQQANRLHMGDVVAGWQANIKPTADTVALWNAAALSQLISGYNRFVKGQRGVVISALTKAHGTFSVHIDSSKLPVDDLRLYTLVTGGASVKQGPYCSVGTKTSASWTDSWTPAAGDALYVVDMKVAGTDTVDASNITDYGFPLYNVDEAAGTAEPVVLT